MSGVRIKDLQSAKPLIEQHFNEMEFIVDISTISSFAPRQSSGEPDSALGLSSVVVDLPQPDATLKMSGAELKEAVGIKKHIHPLEEVDGLPGELEKKFDKAGGKITGDLRVLGDGRMKNLRVDEYLEVPELKYNRITATGNEFWVTDAGVVDDAWEDDDDMYVVELKSKEGEVTINFQYKDILRGIFYTTDEDGQPTGFKTAYFEVTGIINETMFHCLPLNGIAPQRFMTLARQGNKTNPHRQGSIYLDGLHKWLRVLDGIKDERIEQKNIKVQLGDLSEINHPLFGQLQGYGALLENAYICGRLVQRNPDTGEDWVVGAVAVQGEQVFRYNSDGVCEPAIITLTAAEFGITSPVNARTWQYKDGAEWVDIPNTQLFIFELLPEDLIWREKRTLTLRYLACGVYYDIITITKVYDGEDAYSVRILSTNGTNFINGDIGTFLQTAIFKGSRDITTTLPDNAFNWFRVSDNPDGDIVWNELHQGAGSRIWIADPDVYRRATFECEVKI